MFTPIAGKGFSTIAVSFLDKAFILLLDFLAGGISFLILVIGGQGNLKDSSNGVGTAAVFFDYESFDRLSGKDLLLLLVYLLEGLWYWRLHSATDWCLFQFTPIIDCWHWNLLEIQDSAVAAVIP